MGINVILGPVFKSLTHLNKVEDVIFVSLQIKQKIFQVILLVVV